MVFMLISIAGAEPFAYIMTDSSNVTVFDIATKKITTNVILDSFNSPVRVTVTQMEQQLF